MSVRQWFGAYQAFVARNDDPLGAQRVTLQIPQVLGTATSQWAAPVSAKGTAAPAVGSGVTAMFLGGDINHPVYLASFSGGSGVASVTAADASVVIGGTGSAPTVRTNTLDQIASLHPPAANWSNNSKKITSLANGTVATDAAAFGQILSLVASTGTVGFALANGTSTFLTWTAPNDGNLHRVFVMGCSHVTTTETGGQTNVNWTAPDGTATNSQLLGGSHSAGTQQANVAVLVQANTVVSVQQATALTAGAATVWAEIWAL